MVVCINTSTFHRHEFLAPRNLQNEPAQCTPRQTEPHKLLREKLTPAAQGTCSDLPQKKTIHVFSCCSLWKLCTPYSLCLFFFLPWPLWDSGMGETKWEKYTWSRRKKRPLQRQSSSACGLWEYCFLGLGVWPALPADLTVFADKPFHLNKHLLKLHGDH